MVRKWYPKPGSRRGKIGHWLLEIACFFGLHSDYKYDGGGRMSIPDLRKKRIAIELAASAIRRRIEAGEGLAAIAAPLALLEKVAASLFPDPAA